MNQQLIDLLRGELAPGEAAELRERLERDAELSRALTELETLFGLMRRGEKIEPSPELRARIVSAAGPTAWQRLRALPGLVRFRFQHSLRFRVVAASLLAHLILMGVLYQVVVRRPAGEDELPEIGVAEGLPDEVVPPEALRLRLQLRSAPHGVRLRKFGVEGQHAAIERELEELVREQRPDGSFGDTRRTAVATLALLAEGDCSVLPTVRGRAIQASMRRLLEAARRGETHGALLAALVEDYVLAFDSLGEFARARYIHAIRGQVLRLEPDEFSGEALALARLAGFPIPSGRELGAARHLIEGHVGELLRLPPTREAATVVLSRGQGVLDAERVRAWVRPLFESALESVAREEQASPLALLTLQAPYRL